MILNLPPAPEKYDRTNEQTMREELARLAAEVVMLNEALKSLVFTDSVSGITGRLTIQSGVVTWTAL